MRKIIAYLFTTLSLISYAQDVEPEISMDTQPWAKNFMEGITVGGFYRMLYYDRIMPNDYNGIGADRQIAVVDPTYYDPMLFLYVGGNPTANSSFGAELRVDNYMLGPNRTPSTAFMMFNGLVLRGSVKTEHVGDYFVRLGGIEWLNMTPFTFGQNTMYNRFSIFTRRPWDPGGNVKQRAASYYHTDNINQDVRFGTNAFKGFMTDITNLPGNLTANVLYGYTQSVNGFDRESIVMPRKVYGAKISKTIDKLGEVGATTYGNINYQDSIYQSFDTRKTFRMYETYAKLDFDKKLSVFAELGYGINSEPLSDKLSDPAFLLDIKSTKKLTKFPISLRAYYIGQYFVNLDSYVQNSTTTPYLQNLFNQTPGIFQPPGARMTGVGEFVNNRMGANLNVDFEFGKLKVITGLEVSKDIERFAIANTVTYSHRINGLHWSRFMMFPNEAGLFGPNQRVGTFYRGAYEIVNVSDTASDGGMSEKLFYHALDLQLKYNLKIAGRDLYLFNLNTWSSVGTASSLVPVMSDKSYIRGSFHELEAAYHIWRDITFSVYTGLELIQGNQSTDVEEQADGSIKARNQIGQSLGLGIDYQMNNNTYLYLRQEWFDFKDRHFVSENFSGRLFTLELKVFF